MSENRISRINEIIDFDKSHGVNATYFVGMANGLSLSYSIDEAGKIIEYLNFRKIDIGIHGIAWDNKEKMIEEYKRFSDLTNNSQIGIRNHYLRNSKKSLEWMNEIGYSYDTTTASLEDPYFIGEMVEFPVCLMDVNVLSMSSIDLDVAKRKTIAIFDKAEEKNLSFFTIIFHDNYFADHYPLHMNWYKWLIPWIIEQGYDYSSFKDAVEQIRIN